VVVSIQPTRDGQPFGGSQRRCNVVVNVEEAKVLAERLLTFAAKRLAHEATMRKSPRTGRQGSRRREPRHRAP
jgi:hypothetical protein